MTARAPLPHPLSQQSFTYAEALGAGIVPRRLRASDLEHCSREIYWPAGHRPGIAERLEVHLAVTPQAWGSHRTAAALQGLPLPPWCEDHGQLHLSKPSHLSPVRRKGVVGHSVRIFRGELHHVQGMLVTTPARTWLDLANELTPDHLVALGDQLIRTPRPEFEGRDQAYATFGALQEMVKSHSWSRGVGQAKAALELMRIGADSVPETLLRLAMHYAGLPEPELQIELFPENPRSPTADLGFRHYRLAIQYEGSHHLDEAQRLSDARRDRAFRAAGWTVLHVTVSDLRDDFHGAIRRIRKHLARAAAGTVGR